MTETLTVENPSTGGVAGTVPALSAEDVAELVAKARAAQPGWAALGFEARAKYLKRMQRWLIKHTDQLTGQIHAENGKTIDEATVEVVYAAAAASFWASKAQGYLADERITTFAPFVMGRRKILRHAPVGVVGVIGPWNNPLLNNFGDVLPALMAGNAVILKPSEITPLTSVLCAAMARECGLPEDVFAVATGTGDAGAALVDHVDMVMFTGSTSTGRKVGARCGERLIPCSLELGGKDPVIVLEDADLARAAELTVFGALHNSGQTCTSSERVYVVGAVYDDFVGRVRAIVEGLRLGESTGLGTSDIGSLTFPPQLEIVERHVADALAKGARALTGGGRRPGPGRFFEPTILVDVTHDMLAMREETFGPTLPIMKVADEDEAVRWANDSDYGLQAAVFTGDLARGEAVAARLEAGAVTVNDVLANYFALALPMGGWKSSGLGSRHGAAGILKYTRSQSLLVTTMPMKRELHTMPFSATRMTILKRLAGALYARPGRKAE